MLKSPCKDCKKRQLGCHSNCPDYIAFRDERNTYLEKANKQRMLESGVYEICQTMKKRKRKREDYSL